MSPPTKKPKLSANRIPTVTILCQQLGFGIKANRPVTELTDTTQFWRKQYKTPTGFPGKDLTKWKDPSVQEDLRLMVQEYLDSQGFGARLWPPKPQTSDGGSSGLEYAADRDRITDLLCQLFWRQNAYTHRNAQFGPIRSKRRNRDDRSVDQKSTATSPGPARSRSPSSTISHVTSLPQRGISASLGTLGSNSTKEALPRSPIGPSGPLDWISPVGTNSAVAQITGQVLSKQLRNTSDALAHESAQKDPFVLSSESHSHSREFDIYDFDPNEDSVPRSTALDSVHPRVRDHPGTPTVVEDTVPLDNSQPIATSSLARKIPTTPSPQSRTSRQSRSGHGDHDSHGITRTRSKEQSEILSTPRRQSKRKRTTRARPEVVAPDVDLDAILNECENLDQYAVHDDNVYASFSKHRHPPALSDTPNTAPSHIQRVDSITQNSTTKGSNAEGPTKASTGSIRETTTSTTVGTDRSSTRPTSVSLPPDSEMNGLSSRASYSADSSKPPVTSKPLVGVRFWIIKARLPRFACEKWTDGKLQGKSLESVLEGVSNVIQSSRIRKLKFTLETADKERTYTIMNDAEDEFEEMKQQFGTDMTSAFRKNRNEFKAFHIWIEPIEGEDLARDGEAEVEDALMEDW